MGHSFGGTLFTEPDKVPFSRPGELVTLFEDVLGFWEDGKERSRQVVSKAD